MLPALLCLIGLVTPLDRAPNAGTTEYRVYSGNKLIAVRPNIFQAAKLAGQIPKWKDLDIYRRTYRRGDELLEPYDWHYKTDGEIRNPTDAEEALE